ncbi:MAG: hypothetical protein FWC62_09375, partial [Firmicutes bacterium]|nr:hypothetical protein [Bacillota bacterium]
LPYHDLYRDLRRAGRSNRDGKQHPSRGVDAGGIYRAFVFYPDKNGRYGQKHLLSPLAMKTQQYQHFHYYQHSTKPAKFQTKLEGWIEPKVWTVLY